MTNGMLHDQYKSRSFFYASDIELFILLFLIHKLNLSYSIMQQDLSYYHYNPSLAAAVLFAVFYGISLLLTTSLCIKHRAWVCAVMVLAAESTSG